MFTRLPAEIRNGIYELVFQVSSDTVNLLEAHPPEKAILLTCRKIHEETKLMYRGAYRKYWTDTRFTLHVGMDRQSCEAVVGMLVDQPVAMTETNAVEPPSTAEIEQSAAGASEIVSTVRNLSLSDDEGPSRTPEIGAGEGATAKDEIHANGDNEVPVLKDADLAHMSYLCVTRSRNDDFHWEVRLEKGVWSTVGRKAPDSNFSMVLVPQSHKQPTLDAGFGISGLGGISSFSETTTHGWTSHPTLSRFVEMSDEEIEDLKSVAAKGGLTKGEVLAIVGWGAQGDLLVVLKEMAPDMLRGGQTEG